ncbi:MAG: AbrB family transcriptional regulator [Desulfovibrio sp.]|nr:AbrB family transcriptional regulator [Desulfovibrio sp.]
MKKPGAREVVRLLKAWGALVALTAAFACVLETLRVPAAPMLGSIGAAIVFALRGVAVREPPFSTALGQSMIGCLTAKALTPDMLLTMRDNWPLLVGCILFAIVNGLLVGWFMMTRRMLPGTTAIWGTSPGGAVIMTVMSASYGADMRLVAVMQYLRILLISLSAVAAAMLFRGWEFAGAAASTARPAEWSDCLPTLALMLAGLCFSRVLRFGGSPIIIPMVLGTVLQNTGLMHISLPGWAPPIGYALLGWSIGLRFDREILLRALHLMGKILGAIAWMMGTSACLAVWLVLEVGIDPVTAYLATSPGGMDSISVIAASCGADLALVATVQIGRLVTVNLVCPPIARFLTARMSPNS